MKIQTRVNEAGEITISTQLTEFFSESKKSIITRGINDCIFLFKIEAWRRLTDVLSTMSDGIKTRKIRRLLLAMPMEVTMEKHAIQLPAYYNSLLGIENVDIFLNFDAQLADVIILQGEGHTGSGGDGHDVEENVRLLLSLYSSTKGNIS